MILSITLVIYLIFGLFDIIVRLNEDKLFIITIGILGEYMFLDIPLLLLVKHYGY